MPYTRHVDPTVDPNRKTRAQAGQYRLVNMFCQAACTREAMIRFEEAFLFALNDWATALLRSTSLAEREHTEVLRIIKRARNFASKKPKVFTQVFATKAELLTVVTSCRTQRHRLKYIVDRKTLCTYMFCKNCNRELRMARGSVEI
jgi:hypothetical protein